VIDACGSVLRGGDILFFFLLTMHRQVAHARRALNAGASGFVLKHSRPRSWSSSPRARFNQVQPGNRKAGEIGDRV